jgi:glycosyltransferase involved in cell wall biosynthesis
VNGIVRLRIALITGSYPPMRCGVGDYSHQLAEALRGQQADVEVFTSMAEDLAGRKEGLHLLAGKWSTLPMMPLSFRVCQRRPDIVHIQYPTVGYGCHLGPQALAIALRMLRLKVVTTVHEFQWAHVLRKLSLLPFLLASSALVFTSEEERAAIASAAPWLRGKLERASYVIPVGSNIPVADGPAEATEDGPVASFFGLFYPGRQVELVVTAFSEVARKHPRLRFRFIGDLHPGHRGYFSKIRRLVEESLPRERVEWLLGKAPEEIAVALRQSDVCVLPYRDGASFRRTTLIAALALGVPVITTRGMSTPALLGDGSSVLFAGNASEMAEAVWRAVTNRALSERVSEGARALSRLFSWDRIADEHLRVYKQVVG